MRAGTLKARPRTQSSIAVSTHGRDWTLCNASPDIHAQLAAQLPLAAEDGLRSSPIKDILLVDGQLDHALGLCLLRENRGPLRLWTTDVVAQDLSAGLPLLPLLGHYCGIERHSVPLDGSALELPSLPDIAVTALPVEGKPAPYSPRRERPARGDNIALIFRQRPGGAALFYAPGLAEVTDEVLQAMQSSRVVLVDGTFWSDEEMIEAGVSHKRAREIGHLPQSGREGMLEQLARLPRATRRILIHINNTNPILDEHSAERAALTAAGVEVAFDGMQIDL